MVCLSRFFKGCLPEILLGLLLNTFSHVASEVEFYKNSKNADFESIKCNLKFHMLLTFFVLLLPNFLLSPVIAYSLYLIIPPTFVYTAGTFYTPWRNFWWDHRIYCFKKMCSFYLFYIECKHIYQYY